MKISTKGKIRDLNKQPRAGMISLAVLVSDTLSVCLNRFTAALSCLVVLNRTNCNKSSPSLAAHAADFTESEHQCPVLVQTMEYQ